MEQIAKSESGSVWHPIWAHQRGVTSCIEIHYSLGILCIAARLNSCLPAQTQTVGEQDAYQKQRWLETPTYTFRSCFVCLGGMPSDSASANQVHLLPVKEAPAESGNS